ncbi:ABC transporter permease [Alicyclobacillus tolerans]|uniref:Iron(III) transport system permease protein n=1 Tax=Alicyclobacillus tolerans TaxID=90970 RepID=A0ABT9LUZ9_9BACL|nr:ABC transporter permease subunit [Alicyclobacillus tengchongensis]MDP9728059.1 iron(III) transport system permease protein [Alicyclobacillus tengchongensis]
MTTLRNKQKWRPFFSGLGSLPGLLIFFLLILYPLAALLLQVGFPNVFNTPMSWKPSWQPLQQLFANPLNGQAIVNSLILGAGSAILATFLATLVAFARVRGGKKMGKIIDTAVWIVFFSPSYVIAQGWVSLMQEGGILSEWLNLPNGLTQWFFSKEGLVVVMALRYIPFIYFALVPSIQNIGLEYEQAGRLLGANAGYRLRRITLPLLLPALLAGASLAFAEGFGDFGMAAAITPQMHIPLITYQIYASLDQTPVNYPSAASLSLILIVIMGLAFYLQFHFLKTRSFATISTHSKEQTEIRNHHRGFSLVAFFILFLAFFLPIGSTIIQSLLKNYVTHLDAHSWTLVHYKSLFKPGGSGLQALLRTLVYALTNAFLTMILGLFLAYQMMFRRSKINQFINLLMIATIAVPGIVLAAGFIFAYNATWLIPLHFVIYGTPICLGMAYLAGSLPYAVRLQIGSMQQVSGNLATAAFSLGASNLRVIAQIVMPLVRTTTVSTFFMTMTGTMFELPASSLLYPPGSPPFPETIQQKFNAFEFARGSAMSILGLIIVLLLYMLGRWVESMLLRSSNSVGVE